MEFLTAVDLDRDEWIGGAVCASTDPELFYPEKGGTARLAKDVCRDCPVRWECLLWAFRVDDRFGVLGGMAASERRWVREAAARAGVDPASFLAGRAA